MTKWLQYKPQTSAVAAYLSCGSMLAAKIILFHFRRGSVHLRFYFQFLRWSFLFGSVQQIKLAIH